MPELLTNAELVAQAVADAIAIREAFGLTIAEVAAHGVTENTAYHVLAGNQTPRPKTALAIRRACVLAATDRIAGAKKISRRVRVGLAL